MINKTGLAVEFLKEKAAQEPAMFQATFAQAYHPAAIIRILNLAMSDATLGRKLRDKAKMTELSDTATSEENQVKGIRRKTILAGDGREMTGYYWG